MAAQDNNRPHLILTNTSEPKVFTAHSNSGRSRNYLPELPRAEHGAALNGQLQHINESVVSIQHQQAALGVESGLGVQLQFVSQPEVSLAIQSLSDDRKGIELLSVVRLGDQEVANVFVPDGKLTHFERYIADYLAEKKDKNGNAIDHKNLLNTIQEIRLAELKALWTDEPELLPEETAQPFVWEVWLPVRGEHGELRDSVVADFIRFAGTAGFEVYDKRADFPERIVVWMYGSQDQLTNSVQTLNCVAEFRKSKDTAHFSSGNVIASDEQVIHQLLHRVEFPNPAIEVPRLCLIDSGVNRAHPLIAPLLDASDMHTIEPAWGVDDRANHGTGLAGIALYGDLSTAIASPGTISIPFKLESVKLIDRGESNVGSPQFHADIFAEAITRSEASEQQVPRVFNSSITATDYRDRGKPSSWSAMLDELSSDAPHNGQNGRLIVQSAGNEVDLNAWNHYPHHLSTNLIHDPGQAWNVITVGAYTSKVNITEHNTQAYSALAPFQGLSPMTSTSSTWSSSWPLKPEVVFEGGNAGKDRYGCVVFDSLSLLTTNNDFTHRIFTTTNATSAASAQCSALAARLMASYPKFRPETIRGLVVHSAEWTDAMRQTYFAGNPNPNKSAYLNLIRHCGWGVPNLNRALWSGSNSLSLVVEDSLQPYIAASGKIKSKDMNLHLIPWPVEELQALGEVQVEMKVTLSYFIEPNPSNRGSISKYYYPSHRLKFDCRRPTESTDEFISRISAANEEDEDASSNSSDTTDTQWLLGFNNRHKGSLHQDIWRGSAAELASRGCIIVYPALGWWRTRRKLEKYNSLANYSLIVSISTPPVETDLYAAIESKLRIQTEVQV